VGVIAQVIDFASSQAYNPTVVCPEIADNGHGAKLPENPMTIGLSGHDSQVINS
jgi:hypothetical protein